MFGPELVRAFREFKRIWDPGDRMNPGKVVDAHRLDQDLRLGAGYESPSPPTHFKFPDDGGSMGRATLRCVGVGTCRREEGGTMCPSYMVTREEMHATRGRAHLLFEMLRGDVMKDGWRDPHVRESLDLCLACKGCKSDCPLNVDMATYKAEFLSHHYEGRLRPRAAYAMGMIDVWCRLASLAPRLANFVSHAPGLARLAKWAAGVAPQREMPRFAGESFQRWFRRRGGSAVHGPTVLLWPDTFNNYFHPATAIAATEVLEAAGYQVEVPSEPVCCGRPLYDFGMLDRAERYLRGTLRTLEPALAEGWPIVGLEPSCLAVFRDELVNLLPDDADARRLHDAAVTFGELIEKSGFAPPLARKAVVHGHCHHKAVLGFDSDRAVLEKLGLELEVLDSGCCGMAGSFGFERAKYGVSIAVGERVLLPAVRGAAKETLVVADGFSCKEQIEQSTDRRGLHLAEVMALALRHGPKGPPGDYPERRVSDGRRRPAPAAEPEAIGRAGRRRRRARLAVGLAIAALGLAAVGLVAGRRAR
jgi:Fe-S oxidoreductase